MLELSEIEDIIERVSYKPQSNLHVRYKNAEPLLQVTVYVPDSHAPPEGTPKMPDVRTFLTGDGLSSSLSCLEVHGPAPLIPVGIAIGIPYAAMVDKEWLLRWVRGVLKDLEAHEVDEWFKYKGKMVNDPHA